MSVNLSISETVSLFDLAQQVRSNQTSPEIAERLKDEFYKKFFNPFIDLPVYQKIIGKEVSKIAAEDLAEAAIYLRPMNQVLEVLGVRDQGAIRPTVAASLQTLPVSPVNQGEALTNVINFLNNEPFLSLSAKGKEVYDVLNIVDYEKKDMGVLDPGRVKNTITYAASFPITPSTIFFMNSLTTHLTDEMRSQFRNEINTWYQKAGIKTVPINDDGTVNVTAIQDINDNLYKFNVAEEVVDADVVDLGSINPVALTSTESNTLRPLITRAREAVARRQKPSDKLYNLLSVIYDKSGLEKIFSLRGRDYDGGEGVDFTVVDENGQMIVDRDEARTQLIASIDRLQKSKKLQPLYDTLKQHGRHLFVSTDTYMPGYDQREMTFPDMLQIKGATAEELIKIYQQTDFYKSEYLTLANLLKGQFPEFYNLAAAIEKGKGNNLITIMSDSKDQLKGNWQTIVDVSRVVACMFNPDLSSGALKLWHTPARARKLALKNAISRRLLAAAGGRLDKVVPYGSEANPVEFEDDAVTIVTGSNGIGKSNAATTIAAGWTDSTIPFLAAGECVFPPGKPGVRIFAPLIKGKSHLRSYAHHTNSALAGKDGVIFDEPSGTSREVQLAMSLADALSAGRGIFITHDGKDMISWLKALDPRLKIKAKTITQNREIQDNRVALASNGVALLAALHVPGEFWDSSKSLENQDKESPRNFMETKTAMNLGLQDVIEMSLRYFPGVIPKYKRSQGKIDLVKNQLFSKLLENFKVDQQAMWFGLDNLVTLSRSEDGSKILLNIADDQKKCEELKKFGQDVAQSGIMASIKKGGVDHLFPALEALHNLLTVNAINNVAQGRSGFEDIHHLYLLKPKDLDDAVQFVDKYPSMFGLTGNQLRNLYDTIQSSSGLTINTDELAQKRLNSALGEARVAIENALRATPTELSKQKIITRCDGQLVELNTSIPELNYRGIRSQLDSIQISEGARQKLDNVLRTVSDSNYTGWSGVIKPTSYFKYLDGLMDGITRQNASQFFENNPYHSQEAIIEPAIKNLLLDGIKKPENQEALTILASIHCLATSAIKQLMLTPDQINDLAFSLPPVILTELQRVGIQPDKMLAPNWRNTFATFYREAYYLQFQRSLQIHDLEGRRNEIYHERAEAIKGYLLPEKQKILADLQKLEYAQDKSQFMKELITQASKFEEMREKKEKLTQLLNEAQAFGNLVTTHSQHYGIHTGMTLADLAKKLSGKFGHSKDEDLFLSEVSNYAVSAIGEYIKPSFTELDFTEDTQRQIREGMVAMFTTLSLNTLFRKFGAAQTQYQGNRINLSNAVPLQVVAEKLKDQDGNWKSDMITDKDIDTAMHDVARISIDTENMDAGVIMGHNAAGKTVLLKTIGLYTLLGKFNWQLPGSGTMSIPDVEGVSYVDFGKTEMDASAFTSGANDAKIALERAISRRQLVLGDEMFSGTDQKSEYEATLRFVQTILNRGSLPFIVTFNRKIYKKLKDLELQSGKKIATIGYRKPYDPQLQRTGEFIEPNSTEILRQEGLPPDYVLLVEELIKLIRAKQLTVDSKLI